MTLEFRFSSEGPYRLPAPAVGVRPDTGATGGVIGHLQHR